MHTGVVDTVGRGEEERVEADLLATDGGALIAFSEDGVILRGWDVGHWRMVRHVTGVEAHPAGKDCSSEGAVLIRLPPI